MFKKRDQKYNVSVFVQAILSPLNLPQNTNIPIKTIQNRIQSVNASSSTLCEEFENWDEEENIPRAPLLPRFPPKQPKTTLRRIYSAPIEQEVHTPKPSFITDSVKQKAVKLELDRSKSVDVLESWDDDFECGDLELPGNLDETQLAVKTHAENFRVFSWQVEGFSLFTADLKAIYSNAKDLENAFPVEKHQDFLKTRQNYIKALENVQVILNLGDFNETIGDKMVKDEKHLRVLKELGLVEKNVSVDSVAALIAGAEDAKIQLVSYVDALRKI